MSVDETGPASPAERFLSAWKRVEAQLTAGWQPAAPGERRPPDAAALLAWAERTQRVSAETARFLHSCRAARNAYAHVCFPGYDGPVSNPPVAVVHRLERVATSLTRPAAARSVAAAAVTCEGGCSVSDALRLMQQHDFSQLPYLAGDGVWRLVTREQVCRWLEVEADASGTVLADLGRPVADLAEDPRVGPVLPRVLPHAATVHDALRELEAALRTPDAAPGGYAVVLVDGRRPADPPRLLATDDLPHLYDLLGR